MSVRKIMLFFLIGITSSTINGQSIVGTAPTNKNIVLEELTGIQCVNCPDGHKIAQQIYDNNPGRVVLLNYHTGGYAMPFAGEPDFRVPFSNYVKDLFPVAGYPIGAINRTDFGAGVMHYRADWVTNAATVLGQSSVVNVGANARISIGPTQDTLIVDVEAYYTSAGPGTSNKMHVVINQNNIPGPQAGGPVYNPTQMLSNGDYNHTHMVRHNLTPFAGDNISNIGASSLYSNQYVYLLPHDYNGVDVFPGDIEVAVFVTEGTPTGSVLNAANATKTIVTPPGTFIADMNATINATGASTYCANSYTPTITVENTSNVTINSFEVSYVIGNNAPVSQMVTNPLASGNTATINFPAITLLGGTTTVIYSYDFASYDNTLYDITPVNNNIKDGPLSRLSSPSSSVGTSISTSFETLAVGAIAPLGAIADNPNEISADVVNSSIDANVNWDLGGFGNSANSFRWDLFSTYPGLSSKIVYEKVDFSTIPSGTNVFLEWSYAYAQFTSENDVFNVLISTDCGNNWTSLWSKSGSQLATAPAVSTGRFFPTATQWAAGSVPISAYIGEPEVLIAFEAIGDYGNGLFLDDVRTSGTVISAIKSEETVTNTMLVYPNPAKDYITVEYVLEEKMDVKLAIYNNLGQVLQELEAPTTIGSHLLDINVKGLSSGVYTINLSSSKGGLVKRFIIE